MLLMAQQHKFYDSTLFALYFCVILLNVCFLASVWLLFLTIGLTSDIAFRRRLKHNLLHINQVFNVIETGFLIFCFLCLWSGSVVSMCDNRSDESFLLLTLTAVWSNMIVNAVCWYNRLFG